MILRTRCGRPIYPVLTPGEDYYSRTALLSLLRRGLVYAIGSSDVVAVEAYAWLIACIKALPVSARFTVFQTNAIRASLLLITEDRHTNELVTEMKKDLWASDLYVNRSNYERISGSRQSDSLHIRAEGYGDGSKRRRRPRKSNVPRGLGGDTRVELHVAPV